MENSGKQVLSKRVVTGSLNKRNEFETYNAFNGFVWDNFPEQISIDGKVYNKGDYDVASKIGTYLPTGEVLVIGFEVHREEGGKKI